MIFRTEYGRWMVVHVVGLVLTMQSAQVAAATVVIPSGTPIYGELSEEASSSKKTGDSVGDIIRGRVWRDVVVNNQVVVPAGAPIMYRVTQVQPRRMFGREGSIAIDAISVTTPNGTEVLLDGGYDKAGQRRVGASIALFLLVSWLGFLMRGKDAVLPPGTVIYGETQANTQVDTSNGSDGEPAISLSHLRHPLSAEILYDEFGARDEPETLPVLVSTCSGELGEMVVSEVNEAPIDPIATDQTPQDSSEGCNSAQIEIPLRELSEHFVRGINRFTLSASGESVSLVLDIDF